MFATDRDLLTLEPNLLRDVSWIGQRLVKGVGDVAGTTLTMTSQDIGFALAGVEAGHVVLVGGVTYEVVETIDNTQLTISRMRASTDGDVIPPSSATDAAVEVPTFGPQIAAVHRQVLRMLGIDAEAVPSPGVVTAESVTNPGDLRLVTSLGALHLIFAAASALSPEGSPSWLKAGMYRDRFARERCRVAARIDTTGDGRPDATRRASVIGLMRA